MYPDFTALSIFLFVGAFSPGPNNLLASYSGFNFGIKRTLPLICGVTFGFPILLIVINFGLKVVFNNFPISQEILNYLGLCFIIYLAYKIAASKQSKQKEIKKPPIFFNMLIFQFINPKAVAVAIIVVNQFVSQRENFIRDSIIVISFAILFSFFSILLWTLLGKFLQRFAHNKNFFKFYNYLMSFLLIICVIMFYV